MKYKALGTQLQVSDMAGTPVFTTIAQLTTIEGPGGDAEEVDVTTQDSAAGFRETLGSFKDPGEISFEGIYDPNHATHDGATGLASLYASGETVDWKLVFPMISGSPALEFSGFVKNFTVSSTYDQALTFSGTIRVSGEVTFP